MDVGGNWEFLLPILISEAAHIAYDLQCVCINGIDVEQIELHLTNNVLEFWNVGPQDTVAFHSSKL